MLAWLGRIIAREDVRQFLRFLLVGASATGLQYLVLIALVEAAHAPKTPAAIVAYLCGGVANYLLNRTFTFNAAHTHVGKTMAKFLVVNLIGLSLNTLIFWLLTQTGLYYLWAQIVASGVVLIWNYAGVRFFVFR